MSDFFNLVSEFISESGSQLAEIKRALPAFLKSLEKSEVPSEMLNSRLLKAIHSIYGGSSFSGLSEIEQVSYKLEKLVYLVSSEKIKPDEKLASIVEKVFSVLEEGIESGGKIKKRSWVKVEKEIEKVMFSSLGAPAEKLKNKIVVDFKEKSLFFFTNDLDISEKLKLQNLYLLHFDAVSDLKKDDLTLFQLITTLAGEGSVLDSVIDLDLADDDTLPIKMLYLSLLPLNRVRKLLNFFSPESIVKVKKVSVEPVLPEKENKEKVYEQETKSKDNGVKDKDFVVKDKVEAHLHENSESDSDNEKEETVSNRYVSFKIGEEHYAVPIEFVFDMKEMLPCSRIPSQPETYLGVANLRGNVIPVIDLRKVFNLKEIKYDEFTVFLILKVDEKIKGCVVDSIDDVVFLESEHTQTAPALSRKVKADFVKFIAKDPKSGRFLIVIDVEKMLKNE
ncbi:MAG: chemotaxis protein CheW [bacterium]